MDSRNGSQPRAGRLVVRNPANDEVVTQIASASEADVVEAVARSRAATADWASTSPAARATLLREVADLIESNVDELAELVTAEMGKPLTDARGGVETGVAMLRQYAELGPLHRGRSLAGARDSADLMVHEPRGVVAIITPWNDPVAVSYGLLGAALVTGNTVVYKPSERTPATGVRLASVLAPAFPEAVLSVLSGAGDVGAALAAAEVDVVAHVGSTA